MQFDTDVLTIVGTQSRCLQATGPVHDLLRLEIGHGKLQIIPPAIPPS